MTLWLVRHGRPVVERDRPAHEWGLDPAGFDDVWALRERLPARAAWYSSPEPKATETAQLLTDAPVGVVDGLREHRRGAGWVDDLAGTVRRAFAVPDEPAHDGWEPLAACRERVLAAVEPILATHGDDDVVLVGHGTAWTVLAAALAGTDPDVEGWARLGLPDLLVVSAYDQR